jgi:hypothetical protein
MAQPTRMALSDAAGKQEHQEYGYHKPHSKQYATHPH